MIDKSWYKKPPGISLRTSAGGVVARAQGDKIVIALVTEGKEKEYILPKGKVEEGESIEEAAAREIGEEAGVSKLELLTMLGKESRLTYKRDKWVTTTYFLFRTTQIETKPTDKKHDYKTEWFDLEKLPKMLWPEQKNLIVANKDKIKKLVLC